MKKVRKWIDKVTETLFKTFTSGDFNHNPFATATHLQNHRAKNVKQK